MGYVLAHINLKPLLKKYQPDVIGLQEIKVADEGFSHEITENLRLSRISSRSERSLWRGIIDKQEPKVVRRGFSTDNEDAQNALLWLIWKLNLAY